MQKQSHLLDVFKVAAQITDGSSEFFLNLYYNELYIN